MILLFISILSGMLVSEILCSPIYYYPAFAVIALFIPVTIFFSRKIIRNYPKYYYATAVVVLFFSYLLTSLYIFSGCEKNVINYSGKIGNKTAVIFYSPGEMSEYSLPNVSNYLKNASIISKPVICFRLKNHINSSSKTNDNLLFVADKVRTSVLNYSSYLFYTSINNSNTRLKSVIFNALTDGCNKIFVINYSNVPSNNIFSALSMPKNIEFKVTKPIFASNTFIHNVVDSIINTNKISSYIYIVDNYSEASSIFKKELIKNGYNENKIIISPKLSIFSSMVKSSNDYSYLLNLTLGQNFQNDFLNSDIYHNILCRNIDLTEFSEEKIIAAINEFKTLH